MQSPKLYAVVRGYHFCFQSPQGQTDRQRLSSSLGMKPTNLLFWEDQLLAIWFCFVLGKAMYNLVYICIHL